MNREEFYRRWKGHEWFKLLENENIKEWAFSYTSDDTVVNILKSVNYFIREVQKTDPNFKIEDLLELNAIEARRLIWKACQSVMEWDKSNRTATFVKSFVSSLYDFVREEDGQTITWKRKKHQIPIIAVRDKHVPTHEEVYRIADCALNTRDKAIILLSYHSGLKGKGISNLRIKDLKPILEHYKETGGLPLRIKITADIYPKRFTRPTHQHWYPALCDKDCADMLLKYYEEERKNASDEDYFFVNREGKRLTVQRISYQVREAIDRAGETTPTLGKNTYAMVLRDAFFNRLVKGGMKDIYREFVMGHTLGVKGHYFNWETEKEEILRQYLDCGFNRETVINHMRTEIDKYKQELEEAKKEIAYFKSKEFAEGLIKTIFSKGTPVMDHYYRNGRPIAVQKIRKHEIDRFIHLKKRGYKKTMENDEWIVMEKELEVEEE